jgi:hypothetical protein
VTTVLSAFLVLLVVLFWPIAVLVSACVHKIATGRWPYGRRL